MIKHLLKLRLFFVLLAGFSVQVAVADDNTVDVGSNISTIEGKYTVDGGTITFLVDTNIKGTLSMKLVIDGNVVLTVLNGDTLTLADNGKLDGKGKVVVQSGGTIINLNSGDKWESNETSIVIEKGGNVKEGDTDYIAKENGKIEIGDGTVILMKDSITLNGGTFTLKSDVSINSTLYIDSKCELKIDSGATLYLADNGKLDGEGKVVVQSGGKIINTTGGDKWGNSGETSIVIEQGGLAQEGAINFIPERVEIASEAAKVILKKNFIILDGDKFNLKENTPVGNGDTLQITKNSVLNITNTLTITEGATLLVNGIISAAVNPKDKIYPCINIAALDTTNSTGTIILHGTDSIGAGLTLESKLLIGGATLNDTNNSYFTWNKTHGDNFTFSGQDSVVIDMSSSKTIKLLDKPAVSLKDVLDSCIYWKGNGEYLPTLAISNQQDIDDPIQLDKNISLTYSGGSGKQDSVTWKSSNPNVATIDKTGKITNYDAGTTTITLSEYGAPSDSVVLTLIYCKGDPPTPDREAGKTSLTISWVGADSGAVRYWEKGSPDTAIILVPGNKTTLTGLKSGTTYHYQVRSNCSRWTDQSTVTTLAPTLTDIKYETQEGIAVISYTVTNFDLGKEGYVEVLVPDVDTVYSDKTAATINFTRSGKYTAHVRFVSIDRNPLPGLGFQDKTTLTVDLPDVAKVTINSASAPFSDVAGVFLACSTEGASIYYTTDGSQPTSSSERYSESFTLRLPAVVKAIGVKNGMDNSETATADCVVTTPANATLRFSESFDKFVWSNNTHELTDSINNLTEIPGWKADRVYSAGGRAQLGTTTKKGFVTTPALNLSITNNFDLFLIFDAAALRDDLTSIRVIINNETTIVSGLNNDSAHRMKSFIIPIPVTVASAETYITFESVEDKNNRFLLDSIAVYTAPKVTPAVIVPPSLELEWQSTHIPHVGEFWSALGFIPVSGILLTEDVVVSITDSFTLASGTSFYGLNSSITIPVSEALAGTVLSVIYNGTRPVSATLTLKSGEVTATVAVRINTAMSVRSPNMQTVAVYPNPSDGRLNISGADGERYEIINMHGRVVGRGIIDASGQLHVRTAGIYLLRLTDGRGREIATRRIVVK